MEPGSKRIRTCPEEPDARLAGQWQRREAWMKPDVPESANPWQYREDLRRKEEEILRLNQCLREKEEKIVHLNDYITNLKEELKNAGARNSGTDGESFGSSYASNSYGGDYASDSYGGGYGSWSDGGGYGRDNSASNYSGPGQFMGKDAGRNEGWGPDSGGGPVRNTGGYSNRGSGHYGDTGGRGRWDSDSYSRGGPMQNTGSYSNRGPYGDSRKPVIQSCPVNTVVTNDTHGSTSQRPSTENHTASDQDDSGDDDKDETSLSGEPIPPGAKKKWKRRFVFPLLKAYAEYKAELTNDQSKDAPVWRKISQELFESCRFKYNAEQCRWRVGELRKEYAHLKTLNCINRRREKLFQAFQDTFESDPSSVVAPTIGPDKWYKYRPTKLLQVYAKHKAQFSRPGAQAHFVWNEIAGELQHRLNMDVTGPECRDQFERLKSKYEKLKNEGVTNEENANFMDWARPAFDNTATADSILDEPPGSLLNVRKRKAGFRVRLLQVYAKYRHDLSPHSGFPELQVWDKISEGVRDYGYECGTYLCRHEVSRMKEQYEAIGTNKTFINPIDMRNLMEEARRAFDN